MKKITYQMRVEHLRWKMYKAATGKNRHTSWWAYCHMEWLTMIEVQRATDIDLNTDKE